MEVFYLKINRPVQDTRRYLLSWLEAISKIPDAKVYIICDKPELTDSVKAEINFSGLDYEFMESNRTSPELQYIVDNAVVKQWKFAAYAHLTTFLHARDMGYKDFWNIDADDIKLYISPERIAELLTATKTYANENKINLFTLDIWKTWGKLRNGWSFGVVYTDNSVDWINIMREHCKDSYFFERYSYANGIIRNVDWICTYLREINAATIETFYFENLYIIHDTYNPYFNPLGSIRYWSNGKLNFSVFENYNAASEFGSLSVPDDVIRLDIGLRAEEAMDAFKKDMDFEQVANFKDKHRLNFFVSIILPISKSNELSTSHSLILVSLLSQFFKRFELVVVDNGSNPDYMNALKKLYYLFSSRLKILWSDSSNIFEMCNEGLSMAKGKYVLFANGADLFLNNFLQSLYSLAEENRADVVYPFNYALPLEENPKFNLKESVLKINMKIPVDKKPWEFEEATRELNDQTLILRLQGFLNGIFSPSAFNKLIRREFLLDNDIKFSPDTSEPEWIFCLKCLCLAKKYIRTSQLLYVRLQKKNFEFEFDICRTVASAEELEKFMARMNFFNDDVKLCKAILSRVLKK